MDIVCVYSCTRVRVHVSECMFCVHNGGYHWLSSITILFLETERESLINLGLTD